MNKIEVSSIPSNWAVATVNDLGQFINGFAFKPDHWGDGGVPIIRIQNLTNSAKPFNYTKIDVPSIYSIEDGDLLVSWSATLDAFIWKGGKAWLNQHIFKVIPSTYFHSGLSYYWMKIAIEQMVNSEHLHGSTMKHINRGPFLAHETRIPPYIEQVKIFNKIEELFSHIDTGVEGLKHAKSKLQQYRQSVLKDAVTGKLTEKWREKNGDKLELAENFLAAILKERKICWKQKQIELYEIKGKLPKTDKWKDKYPVPKATNLLEDSHPSHLRVTLEHLKFYSIYGPRFSSSDYADDGILVLRTTDIDEHGRVNKEKAPKLALTDKEYKKYCVDKGDFLITRTGSIGTLAIYNDEYKAIPGAYLLHYKLLNKYVNSLYIYFVFKSPQYQELLTQSTTGIGIQNINAPTLESLEFLLPSIEEQNEIVSIVQGKLKYIEKCEIDIDIALKKSTSQKSSVLAKAFSGELVENIETDFTAEQLLEKIKAEKQLLEEKAKLAKKKPTTREIKMEKRPIIDVLKESNKALNVDELFEQAGFRSDVSPEGIEAFYQELKIVAENEKVTVIPIMLKEKKQGDKFEYKEVEENEAR
jgi:type I restriction enzyme S subunit